MQDLKTGHLVGATPYRQQIAEIIGVGVGAIAIGPVLRLLHEAFYITRTACEAVEGVGADACDGALLAPQAELIGAIVIGAFGGGFNYPMVALGVAIAVVLIVLKMPVMSVAIGIYLPLALSVPIMFGGIISHVIGQVAHQNRRAESSPSKCRGQRADGSGPIERGSDRSWLHRWRVPDGHPRGPLDRDDAEPAQRMARRFAAQRRTLLALLPVVRPDLHLAHDPDPAWYWRSRLA